MEASDPELMSRLAGGDDLALNILMDRWSERIAAFLYKMTGQRAAAVDLAQETFVKLYQARERYRSSGNFSTYLFAIASNLARNHARWKGRHPTVSMDAVQEDGTSVLPEIADLKQTPDEAAGSAEKFRAVHEAFLCLSPDLREAMTLFAYEGMGYTEIAAISQCSSKAVETRIYRARQILKERLQEFVS
ncbi:MAG: sigma-70 family RNA polymerase sigma factor [Luteolibacter sp.]